MSSYSSADLLVIDSFALSLKYGEQWPALIRFLPFPLFFSFLSFLIRVQTVCEGWRAAVNFKNCYYMNKWPYRKSIIETTFDDCVFYR